MGQLMHALLAHPEIDVNIRDNKGKTFVSYPSPASCAFRGVIYDGFCSGLRVTCVDMPGIPIDLMSSDHE